MQQYQNPIANERYTAWKKDFSALPFLFTYNGKTFHGFDERTFPVVRQQIQIEGEKETLVRVMRLDVLEITLEMAHYYDYGFTEWRVWFENVETKDSMLLENPHIQMTIPAKNPILKGILGDHVNQYRPYATDLQKEDVSFCSDSGRATHIYFPYFNLEHDGGGEMLAIGWAGTWTANFKADGDNVLYTAKSVNTLRTILHPNEKIRTALFVIGGYQVRNEHFATNYWRRWFVQYNLPKADASGADLQPFSACCLASDTGLPNSDGSISERHTTWRPSLEKMLAERVEINFRWFDAGWYIAPDLTSPETEWWGTVGTWTLDPYKWPNDTFLESTEFTRAHGMKTLMWFEPERVTDPENLAKNFGYNIDWAIRRPNTGVISNNIGIPECFRWTTDRICNVLRHNKVEMYREDNNCDAAALWDYLDGMEGENRRGITECKFIIGHYQMWQEIIACTLSLGGCGFVDSCASGGGRNDLESMRLGVPLLRSDSDRTTISLRLSMTTAFNRWIPFCGANTKEKIGELDPTGISDVYTWRASYLAALNVDSQFVQDPDGDFDNLRFGINEWKKVNPYILKDFYHLTPWHSQTETDSFTAYSFFDEEKQEGVLLAFRQERCDQTTLSLALPFPKNQQYILTDADTRYEMNVFGQETFSIDFDKPRTAKLFFIRKK